MTDIICWGFNEWKIFIAGLSTIEFFIGVTAGYLLTKWKKKSA